MFSLELSEQTVTRRGGRSAVINARLGQLGRVQRTDCISNAMTWSLFERIWKERNRAITTEKMFKEFFIKRR